MIKQSGNSPYDFCSVFCVKTVTAKSCLDDQTGVERMDKTVQENVNSLYEICDQADRLPMTPRSTYNTYRQALKTEIQGYIGYLLLHTDLNPKEAARFVQENFDFGATPENLKRLANEYTMKSNLKRYRLELLTNFIDLDNQMRKKNKGFSTPISQMMYLVLFQITVELFRSVSSVSQETLDYTDGFLKKMQQYIISSLNFKTETQELDLKSCFTPSRGGANTPDEQDDDTEPDVKVETEVTETLEELLKTLDDLTGLKEVKKDVNTMINMVKMQQVRQQRGMKSLPMSLHMVFYGNPGTGKTTVARLVSKIYYRLGVLSKGHLIETDRAGLVGGYVGHTALKVKKLVKKALGGILFIDEAYTLTRSQNGEDFGQEAVDTLLKCMEDHRSDLIVIVAGYPDLMTQFISSNPGLQSRFNKYINFQDYKPDELLEIFEKMCKGQGYHLSAKARVRAKNDFERLYENRDENFANGRDVRNYFEKAVARQANRLAKNSRWTDEQLAGIEAADLSDDNSFEMPLPVSGTDPMMKPAPLSGSSVTKYTDSKQKSVPKTGRELSLGQRINIQEYVGKTLEIRLECDGVSGDIDLDGYAFMLASDGKVTNDKDLIFFGNERSADGAVYTEPEMLMDKPSVFILLKKVSSQYEKVSVCFSAYGDDSRLNFTMVKNPVIQVIADNKELFHIELKHLNQEKCLVGVELYKNKEIWKLKAVGAGYNGKLKALCESFGVEIE